jgi:hypothetical protein
LAQIYFEHVQSLVATKSRERAYGSGARILAYIDHLIEELNEKSQRFEA